MEGEDGECNLGVSRMKICGAALVQNSLMTAAFKNCDESRFTPDDYASHGI